MTEITDEQLSLLIIGFAVSLGFNLYFFLTKIPVVNKWLNS